MKTRLLAGLAAAMVLAASSGARATVYVAADLADLVADARSIVHGRVVAAEPRWTDGRRDIETLVTLVADGWLKGPMGGEVTIRVPGGQMGPYRSVMVGAPVLREGDEVVLFLAAQGPSMPHLVGLSQGVFRVTRSAPGTALVVPAALESAGGDGVRLARGDGSRRPEPLDAFRARVARLAAVEPAR